ncbi:uncharacterized protein BO96DRAFT_415425 [Aspergillus niger CBS 101883]|uniref:uncharacterized protein n=1 Tax=Aspergillus lacticoffeatus (strain CBS 101883) TaxID=1450533 RepID=UPI000D7FDB09|nr:uncharacterized protein BO96DRAFT_415425 [Aspergillus niger CBS 101883]PYH52533.1 hypothetical protein BO96DRAFT_415425 [Aspergillus niger CBS 101883]
MVCLFIYNLVLVFSFPFNRRRLFKVCLLAQIPRRARFRVLRYETAVPAAMPLQVRGE